VKRKSVVVKKFSRLSKSKKRESGGRKSA